MDWGRLNLKLNEALFKMTFIFRFKYTNLSVNFRKKYKILLILLTYWFQISDSGLQMTLHCTCHRVALLLQMIARLFWSHYKTCAQIVMLKARWLTRDIDRCKTNRWYWTTSPTPTPAPWRSCGVLNSVDLRDVADKAPGEQQKGDKKRDRGSLMPIWTPWWSPPCWAGLLTAASSQWTSCPPWLNKCNKWRHRILFLDTSYEIIIGLFFHFLLIKRWFS